MFSKVQKWLGGGSGWITDQFLNLIISIYKPPTGNSYVQLREELRY